MIRIDALWLPPRCKTSVLVDIYRPIGTFQPALTCAATDWLAMQSAWDAWAAWQHVREQRRAAPAAA